MAGVSITVCGPCYLHNKKELKLLLKNWDSDAVLDQKLNFKIVKIKK